ncbi:MAG: tetratricopeptide repeat protein [Bacteroidetes bacterium]|nr:tetratricopeptide repeat protein [Bacteroidota bacterium]
MKEILLITSIFLFTFIANAQNEKVDRIIEQGIVLHDRGNFEGAIKKYDEALEIDPVSLYALGEKALTLWTMGNFKGSILLCEKCIELDPNSELLKPVYTVYANSLDALHKPEEAIEIYDDAIEKFPDYYYLYYNKGITLSQTGKYDEALVCFQSSVILNPYHASSHNAIGRVLSLNQRIPIVLSLCRFLVIEPQGDRAKANIPIVQDIMMGSAKKTGKNSIEIFLDPSMYADSTGEKKENDFQTVYLMLTLTGLFGNKKKTEVEIFIGKFTTVCTSMEGAIDDNFGFFWEYYAPYFIEMNDKNFIETFSYLAYASSKNKKVKKWLGKNQKKINKFYDWSSDYDWGN